MLRIAHSLSHLTHNRVVHRLSAFSAANVALVVLRVGATLHVVVTAP